MKKYLLTILLILGATTAVASAAPPIINGLLSWDGTKYTSTTSPYVGFITATSSLATSTFKGNIMLSTSTSDYLVFSGLNPSDSSPQIQVTDQVNDLTTLLTIRNSASSTHAGACITYANNVPPVGGLAALSFSSDCYASSIFDASDFGISGLHSNDMVRINQGGRQLFVSSSTNAASSALIFCVGPGYQIGSCDMFLQQQATGAGFLGIGSTTPYRALSVMGSSDLGTNALAGTFTATSSGTSNFAGNITVSGTASSFGGASNGVSGLTIGTTLGMKNSQAIQMTTGGGTAFSAFVNDGSNNILIGSSDSTKVNNMTISAGSASVTLSNGGKIGISSSTPSGTLSIAAATGTIPFYIATTSISNMASSTLFAIDKGGALVTGGGVPVVTCASGCIADLHTNDQKGTIALTGVQTAVTITFSTPKPWAPTCVVSDSSTANAYEPTSVSTTAVTFSTAVSIGTGSLYYICVN